MLCNSIGGKQMFKVMTNWCGHWACVDTSRHRDESAPQRSTVLLPVSTYLGWPCATGSCTWVHEPGTCAYVPVNLTFCEVPAQRALPDMVCLAGDALLIEILDHPIDLLVAVTLVVGNIQASGNIPTTIH